MWLSIRDVNYLIGYKVGIFESFEDGELAEVYDLKSDPLAYYNVNNRVDIQSIAYLLKPLENRYNQIKKETYSFLNSIDEISEKL